MKILVACEFSGIVRDAFTSKGHNAWSCDLLPSERDGNHLQVDVRSLDMSLWDIVIAFPPCTYLCSSGARWWRFHQDNQETALQFIYWFLTLSVPRIALENPIGIISTRIRKPDQIIQPWQFGHPEIKATCLWLKGLPLLKYTKLVDGRIPRVHHEPPSHNRWKKRSRTYIGIAEAMAEQWGLPGETEV